MRSARPLLLLAIALLSACAKREQPSLRFPGAPVIVISIDTLRSDHLPAYGYRGVRTPSIDALRRDSILFRNAFSPCPMTLPSHVSLLTGLLPFEHGVRDNTGFRFDAATHLSLPALLQKHGYRTGAAVSSFVLRRETGIADAFDFYDDTIEVRPGARFADYQRNGFATEEIAESWIRDQGSNPFFFLFHIYEPHAPYQPSYDGEIAKADTIVGKLLAALRSRGIYDRALIILTSDHGEGLGDHGEQQHSILLYREAVQVPLLLKLPQQRSANTTVDAPAQLTDVFPTVASLLGIDAQPRKHGIVLTDLSKDTTRRAVYSETLYPALHFGWSGLRSVIDGKEHLIEASASSELYDLASDPAEKRDIAATRRDQLFALRKELEQFPNVDAVPAAVDPQDAAKLAALGYIGSARNRIRGTLNPRDGVAIVEQIRLALQAGPARRSDELRKLAAANPTMAEVWIELGNALLSSDRIAEAADAFKKAVGATAVVNADALLGLAEAEFRLGHIDGAESAATLALRAAPREANLLLAKMSLARGQLDRANERVQAAAGSDPHPSDLVILAEIAARGGAFDRALALITRAEQRAAASGIRRVYRLDAVRADVLARMNRSDEAVVAYERAVTDFPDDLRAWANLAVLYFALGDRTASDRTLERMIVANPTPAAREQAKKTRAALTND